MANKFGKFLFFTAVIGTAAAVGYYYVRKREAEVSFGEDADSGSAAGGSAAGRKAKSLRNYVSLNPSAQTENLSEKFSEVSEKVSAVAANVKDTFTPLAQKAASAVQSMQNKIGETMEEFFDEGTPSDEAKSAAEEDSLKEQNASDEQPAPVEAPVEAATESLFDDSDLP